MPTALSPLLSGEYLIQIGLFGTMKQVIKSLLSLLLFTVTFQTAASAQQYPTKEDSMQESLDVATKLMISKNSKSAVLITGKLLERLEKEGGYNTPFGFKVRLIHGSALVYTDTNRNGLDFKLESAWLFCSYFMAF